VNNKAPSAPRCAALIGSYQSGKTTLLESILVATGAVNRKGSVNEGNTVGDAAPEARARQMSVEVNVVTTEYLGDEWTFLDCPGSVELAQEAINALTVVDAAVVVCEPDADKALAVASLLRFLQDRRVPHMVFINKIDTADSSVKTTIEAVQGVSERPLVLRAIPVRDGDGVTGLVDLASERAFQFGDDGAAQSVPVPEAEQARQAEARNDMLESLADFDDVLLEKLLEDEVPDMGEVYGNLTRDFQDGHIVPVFFGSAENGHGVQRLLKALRHETPEPAVSAARLGIEASGDAVVQIFKTLNAAGTGKLSLGRVWQGAARDGMTLDGSRVSGMFRLLGHKQDKRDIAPAGAVVAMGRMEEVPTGALLSTDAVGETPDWPEALTPLYALAIHAEQRSDEVKLSGALAKLTEEDPSLSFEPVQDTGELLLKGLGEVHLQIAIDRLRNRFNLMVTSSRPETPYKETIRKAVSQHARHKKQTGGHGQFGDVHLDIKPLPRGSGFAFENKISGGVVPRQYIPSVENGVKDYMSRGPLGFPVVDISVTLTDGQFHSVDSSDMAFKSAAQLAMREGMPKCGPVLLEPIFQVDIVMPNEFTSRIQRLVSGRRGQIMGFDAKPGWNGWDQVSAQMPQSEMHDLINELRSITLGTGTFDSRFDHLQEFTGKVAEQVAAARRSDD
jgi:elongation factor G